MKKLMNWYAKKLKKINFWDVQLIKIGFAAFVLMVAKLWSGLLALDWYWYLVITVIALIPVEVKVFKKK